MYISVKNRQTALKDYFHFFFRAYKTGLAVGLEAGSWLKFGIGKSYTALRLAEIIDKDFSIEKVVFTEDDFVNAMDMIENSGKPSQVIVIDEAGYLVNYKNWYTMVNKAISDVVMTFRTLRSMAIFVTPTILILDRQLRIFFSHLITAKKSIRTSYKTEVKAKIYKLNWINLDKYYKRKLVVFLRSENKLIEIEKAKVNLPSKELIKEYEKRSRKFKRSIRMDVKKIAYSEKPIDWLLEHFLKHHRDKIKEVRGQKVVYLEELRYLYGIPFSKARLLASKIKEVVENEEG